MQDRLLMVNDGSAWFVRRVRSIVHDMDVDEKVYHCDQHLGGPFPSIDEAVSCLRTLSDSQKREP